MEGWKEKGMSDWLFIAFSHFSLFLLSVEKFPECLDPILFVLDRRSLEEKSLGGSSQFEGEFLSSGVREVDDVHLAKGEKKLDLAFAR